MSYTISLNAIQDRATRDIQRITDLVGENLDYTLKNVVQLSKLVLYDPDIQDIIIKYNNNPMTQYIEPDDNNKLDVFLRNLLMGNEFIQSASIYTQGNAYFNQSLYNDLPETDWKDKAWFFAALNANDSFVIVPTRDVAQNWNSGNIKSRPEFTIARQIKNVSNNDVKDFKVIGVVTINMALSTIKNIITISKADSDIQFIIYDKDGNLIFPAQSDLPKDQFATLPTLISAVKRKDARYEYDHTDYLLYSKSSSYSGWTVAALVSEESFTNGIQAIKWTTFMVIFITLFFAITLFLYLISSISRPVTELRKLMKIVEEGKLDVNYSGKGNGDIIKLGQSFNHMLLRLRQLIQDNYQAKIQRQKAELAALESQLNPHFIYNTLESFQMIAITEGSDRLARMSYSLGQLLRFPLSAGEIVDLPKEIENVKDYLLLIKERYEDRLSYEIHIQEELNDALLPKLTLQPLVENAVYHGIDPKIGQGKIVVDAETDGDDVLIHISDNGVGIKEKDLEDLMAELNHGEELFTKKDHIGIFNIHERIQRIYGNGYGLTISSIAGLGTRVTVRLPGNGSKGSNDE